MFVYDGVVVSGIYVVIGLSWAALILAVMLPLLWTVHFIQRRRR